MIPIKGTFSIADGSNPASEAAARFTLYQTGIPDPSAIELDPDDMVVIADISASLAATGSVVVYEGADSTADPVDYIWWGRGGTTIGPSKEFKKPHECPPGAYPKIRSSVNGQLDAVFHGYLKKAGEV